MTHREMRTREKGPRIRVKDVEENTDGEERVETSSVNVEPEDLGTRTQ